MITIDYFSDVLCVWAYAGQIRLNELEQSFGDDILVRQRFMTLFGDNDMRIGQGWEEGGYEGFGRHVRALCAKWEHTRVHKDVWTHCRPASCTTAHVFLKATALCLDIGDEAGDPAARRVYARLIAGVRAAFFEQAVNIAEIGALYPLLGDIGVSRDAVQARIDDGSAYAALHRDAELMKTFGVQGSPTYVFNEGRQMLYGNVGYRIIEANVRELLEVGTVHGAPGWC